MYIYIYKNLYIYLYKNKSSTELSIDALLFTQNHTSDNLTTLQGNGENTQFLKAVNHEIISSVAALVHN